MKKNMKVKVISVAVCLILISMLGSVFSIFASGEEQLHEQGFDYSFFDSLNQKPTLAMYNDFVTKYSACNLYAFKFRNEAMSRGYLVATSGHVQFTVSGKDVKLLAYGDDNQYLFTQLHPVDGERILDWTTIVNLSNFYESGTLSVSTINEYTINTAVHNEGVSVSNCGPEIPEEGENAILRIHLEDGLEKEYDLTMSEANSFVDWINTRLNGIGQASYTFSTDQFGPFSKKTEFIIYDKIVYFEINEY